MLSGTADLETVLFGCDGIGVSSISGKVLIDMSTISPSASVRFSESLRSRECEMVDAPVSGGVPGAAAATLAIIAGGRTETFDHCLPILRAMGSTGVYAGLNENGLKDETGQLGPSEL